MMQDRNNADAGLRPLMTSAALARALGLTRVTIAGWRVRGNGPPYFKLARTVLYDPADVEQWLAAKRRTSTSQRGGGE